MLKKLFFKASFLSAIASGLNVLATIAIARWYGAEAFTDFTVDLAVIGLFLLLLEVIPSNYAVFKVQDDPEWLHSLSAVQTASAIVLLLAILLVSYLGLVFNRYSQWMLLFIAVSAGKRFLDVRLQSSGRLSEYLENEVLTAIVRLLLLVVGIFFDFSSSDVLWACLSLGMLVAQVVWWSKNKHEASYLASIASRNAWKTAWKAKSNYYPYYLTVVLKRLKDNLIPIAADIYFQSKHLLAAFFLAYKGVVFVTGQVRLIEALIMHRKTLEAAEALSLRQKQYVSFVSQTVALAASSALIVAAGYGEYGFNLLIILSFSVWPIIFSIFERAKAYSNYQSNIVNAALIFWIVSFVVVFASAQYISGSGQFFGFAIFVSELLAFAAYKFARKWSVT